MLKPISFPVAAAEPNTPQVPVICQPTSRSDLGSQHFQCAILFRAKYKRVQKFVAQYQTILRKHQNGGRDRAGGMNDRLQVGVVIIKNDC